MGQLTAPGTGLMDGNGVAMMIGSPQQVLGARNRQIINAAKAPRDVSFDDSGNASMSGPDLSKVGQIGQPSYQEAASAGGRMGAPNAMSPGLSKVGKLATILGSAAQGGLAGMAANAQGYQQSGRNGGFGAGFSGGYNLPFTRSMQQQQLQQAQAQTALTQAQAQQVMTPYGSMPAGLARYLFPAQIKAGAEVESAKIRGASQEASAQTGAQSRVQAAGVNRRFMAVPGVGLFNTETKQVVPGTAQTIQVTPEIAQEYQLPQEFIGKPMSISNLASLENVQNRALTTVQGAAGPAVVNKKTKETTPLGLGAPSQGSIIQVGDVNRPGETTFMTAGQAAKSGAPGPQSASVQVPRAAARGEIPSKIGDLKLAFNTAQVHADLFRQAISAVNNGDQQTLNSLKNKWRNEFGDAGPITAQSIAQAYGREVTKMLSGGHITDAEIASTGATLNPNRQSPQQMLAVVNAYHDLAASKLKQLNAQKNAAVSGTQRGGPPAGVTVRDFTQIKPQ